MEKVKLKDICTLLNGRAYKQDELLDNGKYPVLRVGNFFNDKEFYFSNLELDDNKYCDNGDLLFAWSASFGPKIWEGNRVIFHYHIWRIDVIQNKVLKKYLYYYLLFMSEKIKHESHGGVMLHTTKKEMEEREITLPSLQIQKNIVDKLDKIDFILNKRKQELELLDNLIKSRFVEMFGDIVINTKHYNRLNLKDVAPIQNFKGNFGEITWLLNLDMIESNTGKIINKVYANKTEIGNSTCTFNSNNVLYSKLRPYLNKVVLPDEEGYGTSELLPLLPDKEKINREYLAYTLRSDSFVRFINEKVAGAKMPRVSTKDLMKFKLPIPPLKLQNEFTDIVTQVNKSKFIVQKSIDELQTLYDSLMQKYFG